MIVHTTLGCVAIIFIIKAGDVRHFIVFALGCHGVLCVASGARITEVEAHVRNRVVSFGRLQTPYRIAKTVLSYAKVEALAFHGLSRDADNLLDSTCGIHDSQSSRESVQEKSGARFMCLTLRAKIELAGQVRQHVVPWVLWR